MIDSQAIDNYIWQHGQEPDFDETDHLCDECGANLTPVPDYFIKVRDYLEAPGATEHSFTGEPVFICGECNHHNM